MFVVMTFTRVVYTRGFLINISISALGSDSIDYFVSSFFTFDFKEDFELSDKSNHFDYVSLSRESLMSLRKSIKLFSFSAVSATTLS